MDFKMITMRKIYLFLTLFSFLSIASCSDDKQSDDGFDPDRDITEERGEAPGAEYTAEKEVKYVDVFYYLPEGVAAAPDWQWRLSGVVGHVQDFFSGNLKKFYNINKTFEVVRNKVNPKYVRIHLLQGKYRITDLENTDIESERLLLANDMADRLTEYWNANPSEKQGHHHLLLCPEELMYSGNVRFYYERGVRDYLSYVACDRETFNIKYFNYEGLRRRYLQKLPLVLQFSGQCFGLDPNSQNAQQLFNSLMSDVSPYVSNPDLVRITQADALILDQSEAFNPRSQVEKYNNYPATGDFVIEDVRLVATTTSVVINCEFFSKIPVVRMIAFDQPWQATDSYGDLDETINIARPTPNRYSVAFASEALEGEAAGNGKYKYQAQISIPNSFIDDTYKGPFASRIYGKSEYRLKFILDNGFVYPESDTVYYADALVYPDRLRYQYYWIPAAEIGTYAVQLLTDVRQRNDEVYPIGRNWTTNPMNAYAVIDGRTASVWQASLKDGKTAEVEINIPDEGGYMVDGVRLWTRGELSPVTVSVFIRMGDTEKLVVDNRLIPGDEAMYKYIDFDRAEGVSAIRVRVDKGLGTDVEIGEIEIFRNLDKE